MAHKAVRKGANAPRGAPAPETYDWSINRLRSTPAAFVGTIHGAPDAETAIRRALTELDIPANLRGRLLAVRDR